MKLEVNKVYSGFIVKHAEYVEEVQSEAYLMEHEKAAQGFYTLATATITKCFPSVSARRLMMIPVCRIFWNILRCAVRVNTI